jgi:hypothetical protein
MNNLFATHLQCIDMGILKKKSYDDYQPIEILNPSVLLESEE